MDPDTQHTKPEEDVQKQEAGETVVPTRAQGISKYTPPTDPSKYIRTYAKDVAQATHVEVQAPPPQSAPVEPSYDPRRPSMQSTGVDGVALPEYDASPIDHGDDPSSPKEFEQEKVVLTNSDSDDIFSKPEEVPDRESVLARLREKVGGGKQGITLAPTGISAPIQDVAPSGSLPSSETPFIPAAPEIQQPIADIPAPLPIAQTDAPPGFSSTQTYLPSLAEQIAQLPKMPAADPAVSSSAVQSPSFNFPPLPPDNLPGQYTPPEFIADNQIPKTILNPVAETPTAAPVTAPSIQEALPPTPPPVLPAPTPRIENIVAAQTPPPAAVIQRTPYTPPMRPAPAAGVLSPIHTYSSDFSDNIDQRGSSTFSVLAAQSDAGQTPRTSVPAKKRSVVPLTIGIALLIVGTGVLGGAYYYATSNSNDVPVVAGVPSLITFDESVELSGTGSQLIQSLSDTAQGGSVSGNVVVTYTTLVNSQSTNTPQPGGALIQAMTLPAPAILLRNIDPSSTVGFIRAGTESRPFFLLKVSSYERTFAGMLTWERTISSDLATLYPPYAESSIQTSTTTSATTVSTEPSAPMFIDAIVDNYDVRILRDSSGRSILMYGYYGKDMLVIARDEAAFSALLSRLSATKN